MPLLPQIGTQSEQKLLEVKIPHRLLQQELSNERSYIRAMEKKKSRKASQM